MQTRVWVCGPPALRDAIEGALPTHVGVEGAPADLTSTLLLGVDCLMLAPAFYHLSDAFDLPVVQIRDPGQSPTGLSVLDNVPSASADSPSEIRLAFRIAVLERSVKTLLAELSGPWAHDARGALGVARLALKMLEGQDATRATVQKVENGIVRLGWLAERLPTQAALTLGGPLPSPTLSSLFTSLESYVHHLRHVHSKRPIELSPSTWVQSDQSQGLVPFAAGFVELVLKVTSPRAPVELVASENPPRLEVRCQSDLRLSNWGLPDELHALELSRGHEQVPYRLKEAAELALRDRREISVKLKPSAFVGVVNWTS
jgi:hypothetical protein